MELGPGVTTVAPGPFVVLARTAVRCLVPGKPAEVGVVVELGVGTSSAVCGYCWVPGRGHLPTIFKCAGTVFRGGSVSVRSRM